MKYESDPKSMSKLMLESELNALNYLDEWKQADYDYRDQLETEYHKRIEEDCKLVTGEQ